VYLPEGGTPKSLEYADIKSLATSQLAEIVSS